MSIYKLRKGLLKEIVTCDDVGDMTPKDVVSKLNHQHISLKKSKDEIVEISLTLNGYQNSVNSCKEELKTVRTELESTKDKLRLNIQELKASEEKNHEIMDRKITAEAQAFLVEGAKDNIQNATRDKLILDNNTSIEDRDAIHRQIAILDDELMNIKKVIVPELNIGRSVYEDSVCIFGKYDETLINTSIEYSDLLEMTGKQMKKITHDLLNDFPSDICLYIEDPKIDIGDNDSWTGPEEDPRVGAFYPDNCKGCGSLPRYRIMEGTHIYECKSCSIGTFRDSKKDALIGWNKHNCSHFNGELKETEGVRQNDGKFDPYFIMELIKYNDKCGGPTMTKDGCISTALIYLGKHLQGRTDGEFGNLVKVAYYALVADGNLTHWIGDIFKCIKEGEEKYGNKVFWKHGNYMKPETACKSLLRHLGRHLAGEVNDPDGGLPHLSKVAMNALIMHYFSR